MDEDQWWENFSDMKRQGLDFDDPRINVRKMKKHPRYDDMVDESREILEEMEKKEW